MEQATYDYSTGKIHSPTARASAVHSSSEHTRLTDVRGTDRTYAFDRFRLNHARRFFTFEGRGVVIGSRAFDLLALLVSRSGQVIDKNELIGFAWPTTFVHEANLKVNMSAVRRLLEDHDPGTCYIVTVPGRGYSFVVPTAEDIRNPALPISRRCCENCLADMGIREISPFSDRRAVARP